MNGIMVGPRTIAANSLYQNGAGMPILLDEEVTELEKRPTRSQVFERINEQRELIETHLRVVLFRELIHTLHGTEYPTPPKRIDSDHAHSHTKNDRGEIQLMGEAGRLGEFLAFGTIINLTMKKGEVKLFGCDMDEDRTPYGIDLKQSRKLFEPDFPYPPATMKILEQKPPLPDIPHLEPAKSKTHDDSPFEARVLFPEPDPGQTVVTPKLHLGLTLIIGPEAERMKEVARMHERSCVTMSGWNSVN
ncbi:hypothetical protein L218DRAFT_1010003 [Marasmius fiardii PR-910]|nr:hypothetical protein L218DRAFT_1010003 [Marasmius fiardii PR-910]